MRAKKVIVGVAISAMLISSSIGHADEKLDCVMPDML
jgi:hypothetical protein